MCNSFRYFIRCWFLCSSCLSIFLYSHLIKSLFPHAFQVHRLIPIPHYVEVHSTILAILDVNSTHCYFCSCCLSIFLYSHLIKSFFHVLFKLIPWFLSLVTVKTILSILDEDSTQICLFSSCLSMYFLYSYPIKSSFSLFFKFISWFLFQIRKMCALFTGNSNDHKSVNFRCQNNEFYQTINAIITLKTFLLTKWWECNTWN